MNMGSSSYHIQSRIRGGGSRGVLEFNIDSRGWGAVCDDGFDSNRNAANAVCQDLGYLSNDENHQYSTTHGSSSFAADDISCPSGASSLSYCTGATSPYHDNCADDETVGIECVGASDPSNNRYAAHCDPEDDDDDDTGIKGWETLVRRPTISLFFRFLMIYQRSWVFSSDERQRQRWAGRCYTVLSPVH